MGDYGYELWFLVVVNSVIFIVFALSFFHPKTTRDWRAMGAFSTFILALFTEMYGFPLTYIWSQDGSAAASQSSPSPTAADICGTI